MIINVSINDSFFILYFHLNLDAKFEQYREHYAQTHKLVSKISNSSRDIHYTINRFLNICVNCFVLRKSTFVIIVIIFIFVLNFAFVDKIQSNAWLKIKNIIIIIVKMCIICNKKFYTINECREQFNFKQNRDQLDEKKNNRNDKRRRENDNDNDEKHYANVNNENDEHKIYIIINLNILTIISVMFYEIVY
jgi:hypothetical protein